MNTGFAWVPLLLPEGIIAAAAFAVLALDLIKAKNSEPLDRSRLAALLTSLGCAGALACLWFAPAGGSGPMLALTSLTQLVKMALVTIVIFTAIISSRARFTRHVGEYFALLLLATCGLMLLVSSNNLLMIFVALELLSLCLYILTAFNKSSLASAEAALKYFLFGGMAAAFTLFGISLIYGITGEIQLDSIAGKLSEPSQQPIFYVALVMMLAGFAFKLAAAPFHFWAPDAYQGAPAPVVSFIASASKVGSFFILARILLTGFASNHGNAAWGQYVQGWMPLVAILAIFSMIVGTFAALVQTSVKRLLAYSAIAHAGFASLALLADPVRGVSSLVFYVVTYAISVLGAFAVVAVLEESGSRDNLSDFAGLSRRAPLLSFCMLVFILSLAGIPPLAGFFGKFYVFTTAAEGAPRLGLLWLVAAAIGASAVSFYYYLQVLKQIYAATPPNGAVQLRPAPSTQFAIVILTTIVIGLGCAPDLLLSRITAAVQLSPF